MSTLRPVGRTLLRDEVYARLRTAIVTGELAVGQDLRDADLAAELGLSRAPVRQALTRLAAEGLVDSKPQSYTRVAPVRPGQVRDALHLVRALHEWAARAAFDRMGDGELSRMQEANLRFTEAVGSGDVDGAIAADDEFHDIPVVVAGNQAVHETLDRYTPLLRRLERMRFSGLPAQRSVRRHAELIAAYRTADLPAVERITSAIWTELEDLLED
ncbi:GntR family transcriptional regulator [Amycolatopsis suaedae]|uniref:GntR family transcriptional regulator n=1 Tax=Amycolatopsis suaedae TaxID=2510978 RepID=UPI003B833B04